MTGEWREKQTKLDMLAGILTAKNHTSICQVNMQQLLQQFNVLQSWLALQLSSLQNHTFSLVFGSSFSRLRCPDRTCIFEFREGDVSQDANGLLFKLSSSPESCCPAVSQFDRDTKRMLLLCANAVQNDIILRQGSTITIACLSGGSQMPPLASKSSMIGGDAQANISIILETGLQLGGIRGCERNSNYVLHSQFDSKADKIKHDY